MSQIEGGFYIKARRTQALTHASPHIREIYDWLMKEANHKDSKDFKRGQTLRAIKDIQDGLHWYIGYRKEIYSKSQCEIALKWLRKHEMIQTTKTTRGMIITVLNYEEIQNPKNYETNNETNKRRTRDEQSQDTINKNVKNDKNIISKDIITSQEFSENSVETKLANLLLEKILINNPSAKKPDIQKWAAEVDKMLRIDSRTEKQIEFLINWTQQDNFWKLNILSPFKLRKHWDRLVVQAKSQYEQQSSNLAIIS